MDYQALPPTDLCDPRAARRSGRRAARSARPARGETQRRRGSSSRRRKPRRRRTRTQGAASERLPLAELARVDDGNARRIGPSYIRLPLGWPGEFCRFAHPLDYIGFDGGGGIGSGPGMAIGAALALRGGDRLPVAVLGDGDYLMGVTALWTGVHYRVPVLIIVANNESFFNDELHQERMAQPARTARGESLDRHCA